VYANVASPEQMGLKDGDPFNTPIDHLRDDLKYLIRKKA